MWAKTWWPCSAACMPAIVSLWAATGWFLERYQRAFRVTEEDLSQLERHRPASPHYLPRRARGKGGTLLPRWNLILPETLLTLSEPSEV